MDLRRQYAMHKEGIQKALSGVCEDAAFSGRNSLILSRHAFIFL
jgi:hypothetical protein